MRKLSEILGIAGDGVIDAPLATHNTSRLMGKKSAKRLVALWHTPEANRKRSAALYAYYADPEAKASLVAALKAGRAKHRAAKAQEGR